MRPHAMIRLALLLVLVPLAGAPASAQKAGPTFASAPIVPTAEQAATLASVSHFFNETKHLKGVFAQTNPDGKRLRGRFALKQPGKFRFDYGYGSKLVVMSNGDMLAVQDSDIASDSRYDIDRTPFRLLLRRGVDLARDARIYEVEDSGDMIVVTLADKSPEAVGRIRLFFSKSPALELREWLTTDAQGTLTRVEVGDLSRPDMLDDAQFKIQGVARN